VKKTHFTSIDDVYEFVMEYVNIEKGQSTEFKLDRMRSLAQELGNPHLGRLTVHVAGSKGKGSVATFIANVLEESGLRTGLYTSPHIISWKERMTEAGAEIPDSVILRAAEDVYSLVGGRDPMFFPGDELPTYFELTTLIAFCTFRNLGCNAQVIEVGLGGRLDSTNIVIPDVSVITPIELEHTEYLGSTIAQIASEKAGIIKPNVPVCTLQIKNEALKVIKKKAIALHAPCHIMQKEISISGVHTSVEGTSCTLETTPFSPNALRIMLKEQGIRVNSPLIGAVYSGNMALAALALSQLPIHISTENIINGFAKAEMLARFQIISRLPLIVLDGAHTPESVRSILPTFLELSETPRILLFACAHDKHHREMAEILCGFFDEIIITRPGTFKQSDPSAVFSSFSTLSQKCELIESTEEAIVHATTEAAEKRASLLVTGSFYLCAEFIKWKLRSG
jgi:dihydrofolate synthase/folylpolyglutamate synthase